MAKDLETRLATLEQRVAKLEKGRSGRKAKLVLVSEVGVCGIDRKRDSETCPDASIYYKQQGCKGTLCVRKASQYYRDYRKNQAARADGD